MKKENKEFYKEVGLRLKQARKAKKLTQQQASTALGLARSSVTAHERGENGMTQTMARKYAELYDVSVDFLIGYEVEEPTQKVNPFDEFSDIEFTDNEIVEIKAYIKYILSKRELSA